MPTYEYACRSCEEHIEVVQSFADDPLQECGLCGGSLRKVFSPAGIIFKGSGYYLTDSRAEHTRASASNGAAPSADGSSGGGDKDSTGSSEAGAKHSDSGSSDAGAKDSGSGSSDGAGSTTTSDSDSGSKSGSSTKKTA